MKFKFLLNETDGDTSNGGGSGQADRSLSKGVTAGQRSDGDADSSDNDSTSPDRKQSEGFGSGGGILGEAIRKAEAAAKAASATAEDSGKDEGKNKEDQKEDPDKGSDSKDSSSQEDEFSEDFDESKLTTKGGRPPSPEVGKFIKGLKGKLSKLQQELNEAKASKPQLTEDNEEFVTLKEEYSQLKSKFDDHFFEQSDGFKEAFIKPVQEVSSRIAEFFVELDQDDRKKLHSMFDEAVEIAKAGKKTSFYSTIDTIVDEFMPNAGRSSTAAFTDEMKQFYEAVKNQQLAMSEKGETRKKLAEAELEKRRSKNVISVDSVIGRHIKAFEVKKAPVLSGLKGKDLDEYKALYNGEQEKLKKHLNAFAVTGEVPDELAEIIANGITAKAHEHEAKLGWIAFKTQKQNNDTLKSENEELKKRLAKYTSGPGSSKGSYVNSTKDSKPQERVRLGDAIRNSKS